MKQKGKKGEMCPDERSVYGEEEENRYDIDGGSLINDENIIVSL